MGAAISFGGCSCSLEKYLQPHSFFLDSGEAAHPGINAVFVPLKCLVLRGKIFLIL